MTLSELHQKRENIRYLLTCDNNNDNAIYTVKELFRILDLVLIQINSKLNVAPEVP